MSEMGIEFKQLLLSKLKEFNDSNDVTKYVCILDGDIDNLTDKCFVLAIEDISRCLHKYKETFEGVSTNYLYDNLYSLCESRGISFDTTMLGNGMMSVMDYKFVKDGHLIHDFAIVLRGR